MKMCDMQPTIENRLEIGHNKSASEHRWEDNKA